LVLIPWRTSYATPMASWICLPSKNPNYSLEINLDSNFLILLAITLATTLYIQLHKEIGYKSSKDWWLFVFGIRAMKVELKDERIFLDSLDSSTTFNKSLPIISYKPRKNSIDHPFSLRLLSFWKLWSTSFSSSSKTSSISALLSSSLTKLGKYWVILTISAFVALPSALKRDWKWFLPIPYNPSKEETTLPT